jgi:spore coat protein U-like protein
VTGLPRAVAALLALAVALGPARADAAVSCTVSTTPLAFGSYDPILANRATPLDSLATVSYDCTGGTPALMMTLSAGAGSGFNPRLLFSGGNTLTYNLFLDAGRNTVWGDGTSGTSFFSGTKKKDDVRVFGRVFAGQDPAVGSYSNSIVITINF